MAPSGVIYTLSGGARGHAESLKGHAMFYWVWFGTKDSNPEMDTCVLETESFSEAFSYARELEAEDEANVAYITSAEQKEKLG